MSLAVCVCDIKIYVAPILLLKVFTHSHLLRTSVLYSTYGHETAWTASYEPVRQAVLDTDPDSAAADESFFWIQIPILLLLMKVF